jgi:hypothetical protein
VISYQGLIQGVNALPVKDSAYPIAISLWTDSAGGSQIWEDVFQTPVKSGIFNILLGSQTPLPSPSEMDKPLWLSVKVGGFSGIILRSRLSDVPMAINVADNAITTAKLADSSVTTSKIADSSITPEKMNLNYVSSINMNGIPVTGNGGFLNLTGGNGINLSWDAKTSSITINGTGLGTPPGKGGFSPLSIGKYVAFYDNATLSYTPGTGPGATNQVLHGDGGVIPTWGPVNLPTDVGTSILGLANGGTKNIPQWSSNIGSGGPNFADIESSTVAGGSYNYAQNIAASVGGGFNNRSWGDDAVVGGGEANTIGADSIDANAYHSTISGGADNTIRGANSTIAGGTSLILGPFSFGFNGDDDTTGWGGLSVRGQSVPRIAQPTNLSDSSGGPNFKQIAYFGNVNMMLGNVDGTARQLKFYAPNTSYSYSGALYSSFQAGSQSGNIVYTLPMALPTAGQFLQANTVSGTDVALSWATPSGGGGDGGSDSGAWLIAGNLGTAPPTNYIGTIDSEAFEIHVNNSGVASGGNQRVMRYTPGSSSPNITGGSSANILEAGLSGAAILSGGSTANPNIDSGTFSDITGEAGNKITGGSEYSHIGGGRFNRIDASDESAIVGGYSGFMASSNNSIIGSGFADTLYGSGSSILGGSDNQLSGDYSTLLGGLSNNIFLLSFNGQAVLVGGENNLVQSSWATLVGGYSNSISSSSDNSFLGGGSGNIIQAIGATDTGHVCNFTIGSAFSPGNDVLGGGQNDTILGTLDALVGGNQNKIDLNGTSSDLVGGDSNYVGASVASLGGGYHNVITTAAYGATIPGGAGLIAAAAGQFVAGIYNIPDSTTGPNGTLAIFGSGMEDSDRVNVFTISKTGSATAYQEISNTPGGGGLPTTMGTMYNDNTIEAYGTVVPLATAPYDSVVVSAGVSVVLPSAPIGVYTVQLNIVNHDGTPHVFSDGGAAITVALTPDPTLAGGPLAGMIVVTQLSAGIGGILPTFSVYTFDKTGTLSNNYGFQFHVVAR